MSSTSRIDLAKRLRTFAEERDWQQFHSPKNLTMALSVEVAELMEHFQWMDGEASREPSEQTMEKIREEVADVYIYLIRLADELNIGLEEAALKKIDQNAKKYPADMVRGSSKKYTEYES
ncbi:nucleotide pyrophosphohydrolase [Kiritimatiellota bacterium B12222]|nr:nucleotide pyrophosphohydrolase [Kiritimatiellota bacterium B12222]